jgi:hypothetical protein
MSQESQDAAKHVKTELDAADYHLKRAAEKVLRVPDKELQRKVQEVKKAGDTAREHVDQGLEQK